MVMDRKKNKLILYHAGHYGFLSKFLIHKMDKHDGDKVVILVDCSFASSETKMFLSEWNNNNGSGCEVVTYTDKIFWNHDSVNEVKKAVIEYFDELFYKLDIDIRTADHIYSGYDGLNAFAAYLCIKDVKYIAFDSLGNTTNYRLADSLYDNNRVKYSDKAQAYLDLLKEYDVLTARSEYVSSVLLTDISKATPGKKYDYFNYLNTIRRLSKDKKQRLRKIYGLSHTNLSKGILIPLRSYAVVKYSGVKYDSNLTNFQKLLWVYRIIVDCFYDAEEMIILKAHPNYALSADVVKTFHNSVYLGGHIPFDLLEIIDVDISSVLSIGGSSSSFSTRRVDVMLPENFFSSSLQVIAMYSSYQISETIFGCKSKIQIADDKDNNRFSSFFMGISKNDFSMNTKSNTIILDSKNASNKEIMSILNSLDAESIIVLQNPDVFTLPRQSFISYLRIGKKEHVNYSRDIMGEVCDEFIAVLYTNPKYKSILDNFYHNRSMSRCGFDLIIESVVSLHQDDCAKPNKVFDFTYNCAISGDPNAMGHMGRAYRDGRGVRRDINKATEWMRKAADKNVGWAKNELFDILWNIGTPESYEEMVSIITDFSETGDCGAIFRLGRAFRFGKGVEKDLEKSVALFEKASKKISYAKNEQMGALWEIGTPESYAKTIDLAHELFNAGNGGAAVTLGRAYRDGKGVTKNPIESAKYFDMAVNRNVRWAANELFDVVVANDLQEYDIGKIVNIISILAKSGDINAMGHMGRAYRDGKGVEKDLDRAEEWMKKAMNNGSLWAKKELLGIIEKRNCGNLTSTGN